MSVNLDAFFDAYVEAALFSTNDESDDDGDGDGEPLDNNYSTDDLHPDTIAQMRKDCQSFLDHPHGGRLIEIAKQLEADGKYTCPGKCSVIEYAGHDFWMTRNGHGVGFWEDGDWPKGMGKALDKLASSFGEFYLYLGDDKHNKDNKVIYGCG